MLKQITEDNFSECLNLKVEESQEDFVASNIYSLAQAWLYPNNARPFAIYNDEEMVGFLMLDIDCDCDGTRKTSGLWRLMMDKNHQNKGYGKAALEEAIKHIISEYNPETFRTSVVPGNDAAEKLYRNLGFEPNGEYDDDEMVMVKKMR
jgi:diamine N-acetyltransferase